MTTAVLSIGSNLGDRLAHLQLAVDTFRAQLILVSPVVETPPWGPVQQGDYLNAVLVVSDPDAGPQQWLAWAHAAEAAAGRTREVRWGPRTLDVDVVNVCRGEDELRSDDPALVLPHPRASERGFVLVPWLAADPRAVLGGHAVADLLQTVDVTGIRPRPDLVLR